MKKGRPAQKFCKRGHDISIRGRMGSNCVQCYKENHPLTRGSKPKQFCLRGHDTFLCGRTKWRACCDCEKIKDEAKAKSPCNKEKAKIRRNKCVEVIRKIFERLKNKPCMDCWDWFNPWQMDFDHRPGTKKDFEINKFVRVGKPTDEKLKLLYREIEKCDLVCSNCHRERTYRRSTCE